MRSLHIAAAGAAAGGLLYALWWLSGREPRWVYPPRVPSYLLEERLEAPAPATVPIEGHECTFPDWWQPTEPERRAR